MLSKDKRHKKFCGTLLAVSSLPSKDGIGTFGEEAYKFIDFLYATHQNFWQMLPIVPLGEGNSPYKSISCFAGEMLYIDLNFLVRDGLLTADDIKSIPEGDVCYSIVREYKIPLLKKAAEKFDTEQKEYIKFCRENQAWLDDYSVFAAAMDVFGITRIQNLPDGIKYRIPKEIDTFCLMHPEETEFHKIMQFLFYRQFFALKRYAAEHNIKLIGDIPFYVSADSADVWANPDDFMIDRNFNVTECAGVPPDIFSSTGQLWGNPIYNWEAMRKSKYDLWCKRLQMMSALFDVIRIDHFRAFANYYSIPASLCDARQGRWFIGEGKKFWDTIKERIGHLQIIAEDLGGEEDKAVQNLINETEFPNMKVLQFAFSGDTNNCFLPHNFGSRCVCYTGTHDNDTVLGWYNSADPKTKAVINAYVPRDNGYSIVYRLISYALSSPAQIVIIPMQDWLELDSNARMNIPGSKDGNWRWRMKESDITNRLVEKIIPLLQGRRA